MKRFPGKQQEKVKCSPTQAIRVHIVHTSAKPYGNPEYNSLSKVLRNMGVRSVPAV